MPRQSDKYFDIIKVLYSPHRADSSRDEKYKFAPLYTPPQQLLFFNLVCFDLCTVKPIENKPKTSI